MIRNPPSPVAADLFRLAICAREWRRRLARDPELPPPRPGWPILRRLPIDPASAQQQGAPQGLGNACDPR